MSAKASWPVRLVRRAQELPGPDARAGEEPGRAVGDEDVRAAVAVEVAGRELRRVVGVVAVPGGAEVEGAGPVVVQPPVVTAPELHGLVEAVVHEDVVAEVRRLGGPAPKREGRPREAPQEAVALGSEHRVQRDVEVGAGRAARVLPLGGTAPAVHVEAVGVGVVLPEGQRALEDVVEARDVAAVGLPAGGDRVVVVLEDVPLDRRVGPPADHDPVAAAAHGVVVEVVPLDPHEGRVGGPGIRALGRRGAGPVVGRRVVHPDRPADADGVREPLDLVVGHRDPAADRAGRGHPRRPGAGVLHHGDRLDPLESLLPVLRAVGTAQVKALDAHVAALHLEEREALGAVVREQQRAAPQVAALAHELDARTHGDGRQGAPVARAHLPLHISRDDDPAGVRRAQERVELDRRPADALRAHDPGGERRGCARLDGARLCARRRHEAGQRREDRDDADGLPFHGTDHPAGVHRGVWGGSPTLLPERPAAPCARSRRACGRRP